MRRSFFLIGIPTALILALWSLPGLTQGAPDILNKIKTLENRIRTLEANAVNTNTKIKSMTKLEGQLKTLQAEVKKLKTKKDGGKLTKGQRKNLKRLKDHWPGLKALIELSPYVIVDETTINGLKGPHVFFVGANVHIRSGSEKTSDGKALAGLGNLVIGYNESSPSQMKNPEKGRSGSHNLIVGDRHQYTSYGGIVAGRGNTISQPGATVLAGKLNIANGPYSSITGGAGNQATGSATSISGGQNNQVDGQSSSVSGGFNLKVSGDYDWGAGNLLQDQ